MQQLDPKEIRAELIESGHLKPGPGYFVTQFHNLKRLPVFTVGVLTQKQLDAPYLEVQWEQD